MDKIPELDPDGETLAWIRALALMLLAGMAGALASILRSMDENVKITWTRVLVEFCASAFVGLLVMWSCQAMHASLQVTAISTGVCGWMGAKASIQVLQGWVWSRLGLNRRVEDDEDTAVK